MDDALSMMVLMLMILMAVMIMRTHITRLTTDRWHDGCSDGVVFSSLFLLAHQVPGVRLNNELKHLQTSVSTDWSIPHNTSSLSLSELSIPPTRTTIWFILATRLVRPVSFLGNFTLVATVVTTSLIVSSEGALIAIVPYDYPQATF